MNLSSNTAVVVNLSSSSFHTIIGLGMIISHFRLPVGEATLFISINHTFMRVTSIRNISVGLVQIGYILFLAPCFGFFGFLVFGSWFLSSLDSGGDCVHGI